MYQAPWSSGEERHHVLWVLNRMPRHRVLIVEDEPDIAQLIKHTLEAPSSAYLGAHLTADFEAVSMSVDGQSVRLTRLEFELLRYLVRRCPCGTPERQAKIRRGRPADRDGCRFRVSVHRLTELRARRCLHEGLRAVLARQLKQDAGNRPSVTSRYLPPGSHHVRIPQEVS
jgi:hypothetical protein